MARAGSGSRASKGKGPVHRAGPKSKPAQAHQVGCAAPPRAGRIAIVGRPNVGKSTLLNKALELPLCAVAPTPQTTRVAILGVLTHGGAQLAFVDTPGLHKPKNQLGRAMNRAAREAARAADVLLFMTEAEGARVQARGETGARPHPGDVTLLSDLPDEVPTVLVINKIDRLKDKTLLLQTIIGFSALRQFSAVVPICAKTGNGVGAVLDEVAKLCPEGPALYGEDELTDRPTRFFAAEYVREQILLSTKQEVPYAAAVEIQGFEEPRPPAAVVIEATVHVERPGQKRIVVGAKGEMLKRIGTRARLRIEELLERKVMLKLWVRVTPSWRESLRELEELGYASDAKPHRGKSRPAASKQGTGRRRKT